MTAKGGNRSDAKQLPAGDTVDVALLTHSEMVAFIEAWLLKKPEAYDIFRSRFSTVLIPRRR
jgi:hypothetical protein